MADFIKSRPVVSSALLVSSTLFIAINLYPEISTILALIPANLLITHNYVWILLTTCFLEKNAVKFVFDIVLFIASFIEVNWKPFDQFCLYLLLNIVCCSVGSLMWLFYRFYITGSESYLLDSCYGCGGVIMSILMFIRRQNGSQPVIRQYPKLTYNYLPTCVIAFYSILWVLGVRSITVDISFYWTSYLFSWSYLRFYYKYAVRNFLIVF
jgi:hypothetical protein